MTSPSVIIAAIVDEEGERRGGKETRSEAGMIHRAELGSSLGRQPSGKMLLV
jgi:hypothetical protein